jgi:hypothetical protein
VGGGRFAPALPVTGEQLAILIGRAAPGAPATVFAGTPRDGEALVRRELARVLQRLWTFRLEAPAVS